MFRVRARWTYVHMWIVLGGTRTPYTEVYVRIVNCIEKLYYSAGYDPICIYCATDVTAETLSTFHNVVTANNP